MVIDCSKIKVNPKEGGLSILLDKLFRKKTKDSKCYKSVEML